MELWNLRFSLYLITKIVHRQWSGCQNPPADPTRVLNRSTTEYDQHDVKSKRNGNLCSPVLWLYDGWKRQEQQRLTLTLVCQGDQWVIGHTPDVVISHGWASQDRWNSLIRLVQVPRSFGYFSVHHPCLIRGNILRVRKCQKLKMEFPQSIPALQIGQTNTTSENKTSWKMSRAGAKTPDDAKKAIDESGITEKPKIYGIPLLAGSINRLNGLLQQKNCYNKGNGRSLH